MRKFDIYIRWYWEEKENNILNESQYMRLKKKNSKRSNKIEKNKYYNKLIKKKKFPTDPVIGEPLS